MTLLERLTRTLDAPGPADLLTGDEGRDAHALATNAAVLVPIVARAEPTLLLTVRADTMRHHAGQIAFPGGCAEPGEDAVAAALREAREEIGLDAAAVQVIGTGDPYRTVTGFAVTPVLGVIAPDLPLVAQASEVAEIFEAPLAYLTDPANQAVRHMEWRGRARRYHEIAWGDKRIWGATAAMIVNLSRRLEHAA